MNDISPDQPLSIADLIRLDRDRTGDSYMDLARRTGLSKARIAQLASGQIQNQVRSGTIEKLALGLRLPIPVVKRAALVTSGITTPESARDARLELIMSRLEMMDDTMIDVISAMVDAAARSQAKKHQ